MDSKNAGSSEAEYLFEEIILSNMVHRSALGLLLTTQTTGPSDATREQYPKRRNDSNIQGEPPCELIRPHNSAFDDAREVYNTTANRASPS